MTLKTCLRCDWQGETTEPECPYCGVPLYVVGAVPSGGTRRPVRTNPDEKSYEGATASSASDTGFLQSNPPPHPSDAAESSSRSDLDQRPPHEKRPPPANRNKKIGGLAVAAAIGMAAVTFILGTRGGEDSKNPAAEPPTVNHAIDLSVASKFVRAFGAFNGERAITYLADNPQLEMDATTPEQVPVFTSFLKAQGYTQILDEECSETGSSASGTAVRCRFDWHAIRSDQIGLGPYPGRWDFTVRDGEIVSVALTWQIVRFSPQMWEPFRDWVAASYPKDFDVMYVRGGTNFVLTEESTQLWEQHSREYVKVVKRRMETDAGAPEIDYMIDLSTGKKTLLPRAIIQSLGETAEGRRAESQYAASSDGSLLAYVGTSERGTPQIFIAGIDGNGVRQVTHHPTGAIQPAWSPDGTKIAYVGNSSSFDGNLFVLDVRTGEATKITDETGVGGPQFTPDGSSLLYTVYSIVEGVEAAELRTVPVGGGKSTLLFDPQARGFGYTGGGSLSPDGSLVTFMGHRIDGPGAITFVANADGTDWRSIGSCDSNPAGTWSPDGSRIVCGPNGPPPGIRVKNIATGRTTFVAKGKAAIWLDDHTLLVEV